MRRILPWDSAQLDPPPNFLKLSRLCWRTLAAVLYNIYIYSRGVAHGDVSVAHGCVGVTHADVGVVHADVGEAHVVLVRPLWCW